MDKISPRERKAATPVVLVIDDEQDLLELFELTLVKMGLQVVCASSVQAAQKRLAEQTFDLCFTDMRLPDGDGLAVLQTIQEKNLDLPVAVITAHANWDNAVAALKAGAFDYLAKPVSLDQLRALVRSALKVPGWSGAEENAVLQNTKGVAKKNSVSIELLGNSAAMVEARRLITKLAQTQAAVYISGESGSGKELAARSIHRQSPRGDGPFVPVNCGAIPENLMESEFFGYKKGAFTGAESDREGFFQTANQGTLFLDEVADLPLAMQVKLLRAIQEKKIRKVGATTEELVDVRIISATHQNLKELVQTGRFRQDLYYRLNVIELALPPLREMRDDIPIIAEAVLQRLKRNLDYLRGERQNQAVALAPEALRALQNYPFPGNVRELENILERAVALTNQLNAISAADLQLDPATDYTEAEDSEYHQTIPAEESLPLAISSPPTNTSLSTSGKWPLQEYLDRLEKEALLEALTMTRQNRTAAAKLLGITFRSMRCRLERLGIKNS